MEQFDRFSSIKESLSTAQSILIALPKNPNYDRVAAGLALYLSLKKAGRQVSIASPEQMTVEFSSLVGVDKIKTKPEGKNLTISFDYLEDSIEKVSYNIEGGKFNLVIQPKEGFPPLSSDKVEYSYSGGQADLVLTIGVRSIEDLGALYKDNQGLFDKAKIIDISIEEEASLSEKITQLIADLRLPADVDIVSNLLGGIERATGNFSSPKTNAGTFEAAAFCLRIGARRITRRFPGPPKPKPKVPLEPMPAGVSATKSPEESPEEPTGEIPQQTPSPDWLEPKIYKGNTRV
jgi:hypothetical protein